MEKIERTKNASRNIAFGVLLKIYQILIPFVMRTAMIYLMGVQYLGLNSLFTSVLQVLNLAELGVGSAMIYSMYKPIAENDKTTICALMKLYKYYYSAIGFVIAVIGIILTLFIPKLISGDIPAGINIYALYLLNLAATVLSYWLFAYKNSILQAHQRVDIVSKVTIITSTVQYSLQILALWLLKNYYIYVIVALLTQALTNVTIAIVSNKMYPNYRPTGKLPKENVKEINQRIKDLFTAKVGAVIYDSADTVVISACLGLTILAVYQNYFYILTSITGFILIIFTSCTAGIGNSLVTETKEKNFCDLQKFTFIICWISGFCSTCLLCLYQPFMELWVGKELMLNMSAVVCLVVYFFVRQLNSLLNLYKDASGMWHEDKFRPLVAALSNLFLNLILVQYIGIYGVILSTVIAITVVGMPWLMNNLFTVVFQRNMFKPFIIKLVKYCIITIVACASTYYICSVVHASLWTTLVIRGIICLFVPNLIFFITYRKQNEFKQSVLLADNMTKGKLKLGKLVK